MAVPRTPNDGWSSVFASSTHQEVYILLGGKTQRSGLSFQTGTVFWALTKPRKGKRQKILPTGRDKTQRNPRSGGRVMGTPEEKKGQGEPFMCQVTQESAQ